MNDVFRITPHCHKGQRGINMVDLMMWLVIAALLLAAALQAIGYYQKAAYVYQMESDATGAGSNVVSAASTRDGVIDQATANAALLETKLSKNVVATVEVLSSDNTPYLRTTHPGVSDEDAIYLFKSCGNFKAGVNLIPKGGTPALTACGVGASGATTGGGGGGTTSTVSFNTLTWGAKSTTAAGWYAFAASADGKTMIGTLATNARPQRSIDGGSTWNEITALPQVGENALALSADGTKIVVGSQNGLLRYSNDSGANWTTAPVGEAANGQGAWFSVSSSSDGKVIVAGDYNRGIWISKDSGLSWTKQSQDAVLGNSSWGTWQSTAISNDGNTITVGTLNGALYTSNGNGSWAKVQPGGTAASYYALAMSADGTTQLAAKDNGQIWKSTDSGGTWNVLTNSPVAKWRSLAMSDDGTKVAAGTFDSSLYVSKDGGTNFAAQTTGVAATGPFYGIGTSADGSVLVTGKSNGFLYVGTYGP